MKNRLFPIAIGTCFILIIGVAFFLSTGPQTEVPVKTESAQEIVKPTEVSETENVNLADTNATPQVTTTKIDTDTPIDTEKLNEFLKATDFKSAEDARIT